MSQLEPEAPTGDGALLTMRGIVKEFPGVRALGGVDLNVRAGEVHCLLGQNGAGKSTLIKVLSGFHQPDEGTIGWAGEELSFSTPAKAIEHGVATIPISVFYQSPPATRLVRFCFAKENATLDAAAERLRRL